MTTFIIIVFSATFLFIAFDVVKGIVTKARRPATQVVMDVAKESVSRGSERMVRLEAEIAGKLEELRRHEPTPPSRPAVLAAPPASEAAEEEPPSDDQEEASPAGGDPMNDTRCMRAVKEKAEEIEKIGRERGFRRP